MRWLLIVFSAGCGNLAPDLPDASDAAPEACTLTASEPMHAPLHEPACSAEQISEIQSCAWPCPALFESDAGAACVQCIEGTTSTSAEWGAMVSMSFNGYDVWNIANTFGCVDFLTGTTACGEALWQRYACTQRVCSDMTMPDAPCRFVIDGGTCEEIALAGACKPYADAVPDRCAGLVGANDVPAPIVAACFPDPTIVDPNAQRDALRKSLAKIFCGP